MPRAACVHCTRAEAALCLAVTAPALSVLYRDEHLLVVAKPSGLAVHRGWSRERVVALTLARATASAATSTPSTASTGGPAACSSSRSIRRRRGALQEQFEAGEVRKRYLALVRGIPPETRG